MFGELSEYAGAYDPISAYGYPTQDTSSQYTTIAYSLPWNIVNGQIDIQAEALEGYTNKTVDPARDHLVWSVYEYPFTGAESGWSNTQTVAIGNAALTPTKTPSPTVPEFSWLTLLPLFASAIVLAVIVKLRNLNKAKCFK
jgi:hypothetical protein